MAPTLLSQKRLFMITSPRTGSNLFMHLLALPEQPNTVCEESNGYFFLPAIRHMRELGVIERPYSEWTQEERAELAGGFQECFNKLYSHVDAAQADGKTVIVKEHSQFLVQPTALMKFRSMPEDVASITDDPWRVQLPGTLCKEDKSNLPSLSPENDTLLPDAFLMTGLPTFLIRHPIRVFPSYYRTFVFFKDNNKGQMQEIQGLLSRMMTLRWTRRLYDWYKHMWLRVGAEACPQGPIILDADDFMVSPQLMGKYCRLVGLDESKLQFSWEPVDPEKVAKYEPARQRMRDTLMASSGIRKDKLAVNLELEVELEKWKEEFGVEQGLQIRDWVVEAMDDYTYLKSQRLRL
ncbi:hypothetical protein N7457_001291 [Penicillium paradoxum]|uniref:uncharacterized protein n=1 Tax=Penicillium paradoxum TaxID=176176 RepID=UPI0025490EAE|nr:uncharacterized protein N7457_001291 [Penicillium paradoxum]KAJ5794692.1 hypothetical protein N7457_001291 [Penicillium paradoxum]